jgi:hypothetical protein
MPGADSADDNGKPAAWPSPATLEAMAFPEETNGWEILR